MPAPGRWRRRQPSHFASTSLNSYVTESGISEARTYSRGIDTRFARTGDGTAKSEPSDDRDRGGKRKDRAPASDRKAGIALDDLLAQHGPLARFPKGGRVDDPVAKRTAIGAIA